MPSATRSAASRRRPTSSTVKRRAAAVHTTSTPVTSILGQQRHADQRSELEIAQRRILQVGGGVLAEHRLAPGGHRADESLAERDRLRGLIRRTLRRSPQHEPVVLGQEDRGRVRADHVLQAGHEVGQDVGRGAVRERGVHEQLHPAHHLGHALGLGARRLLAEQRLSLLPAADPLGEVPDERREHHLVAHPHAMDGLVGREQGAVPALQLDLHVHDLQRLGGLNQLAHPLLVLGDTLLREDQARAAGCRSPLPPASRTGAPRLCSRP